MARRAIFAKTKLNRRELIDVFQYRSGTNVNAVVHTNVVQRNGLDGACSEHSSRSDAAHERDDEICEATRFCRRIGEARTSRKSGKWTRGPRTGLHGFVRPTANISPRSDPVDGYLGGATATHVRVGDPWFAPVLIGVVLWLGLFLRDKRLRALIPFRSNV